MPHPLRIVFMGTPDFAVASLKYLKENGHSIAGVITAPDKPAGRGKRLISPAVKNYSLEAGIEPILQPTNLKDPGFLEELKSLNADLQIVVAFRMLPEVVWSMPRKGTINLHASLLPNYRGAAPINWAIINGEKETGVTSFFIEKEIDTGKIIFNDRCEISPEMSAGELHDTLMEKGARLLDKTIRAVEADTHPSVSQNELMENKICKPAPKIFKEDCKINWKSSPEEIHNFIRGLSPYPAAFTEITDGQQTLSLKIFRSNIEIRNNPFESARLETDHKSILKVRLSTGDLIIHELQLAGKKRMNTADFLRGFKGIESYRLKDL